MSLDAYDIRPIAGQDQELEDLDLLFTEVWPKATHLNFEYLDWIYNKNPYGKAIGYNAYHDAQLIGHYATIPLRSCVNGSLETGILSLNTAIHTEHRGAGLFKILANKTYELAISNNFQFVVGVSNQRSTLLFRRLLKFQLVGKLDVKIGFGSIPKKSIPPQESYKQDWDLEAYQWRVSRPGSTYTKGSRYILIPTGRFGIHCITESDARFNQLLPLKRVSPFITPLRLWIGLDGSNDWKKSLYMDLPEKYRTSPLNFIFKDLTDKKRMLDKEQVSFSTLDFDAY